MWFNCMVLIFASNYVCVFCSLSRCVRSHVFKLTIQVEDNFGLKKIL